MPFLRNNTNIKARKGSGNFDKFYIDDNKKVIKQLKDMKKNEFQIGK